MNPTPAASAIDYGRSDLYYRHTGMIPIPGLLLTLGGGLVVGVIGAVVYAYAIRWISFIYIRILCPIALGALIGFTVAWLARLGKLRNRKVTLALVGVVALVSYYAAWVFWIKATFEAAQSEVSVSAARLLVSPSAVWGLARLLNETGTWGMKRSEPISGMFLTLIWFAEAAIIFGLAFITASATGRDEMYCETCDRWAPAGQQIRRTAPDDPVEARQRLEAHDFAYIDSLQPDFEGSRMWWSFVYRRCQSCENLHTLSLIASEINVDKQGNAVTKNTAIVNKLMITPREAMALRTPPTPPAPPELEPPELEPPAGGGTGTASNTPSEPDAEA